MTISFEEARVESAAEVYAVTHAAYAAAPPLQPPSGALAETVEDVERDLAAAGGVLARQDGAPVASLRYRFDDGVAWLRRVGVIPELRRHGVGSRLVSHAHASLAARDDLAELRIGVRHARPGARRFWLGLGYADAADHDYWAELRRDLPYVATVPTADEMRALGRRLAAMLQRGDLVVCVGGLGAGKTTLAQGVGAGLGVEGAITSPTFVLAREHPAGARGVPFVHVDAYRLGAVRDPFAEIDALDLEATLDDAVSFVEWGEGLVERLTVNRVEVRLSLDLESEDRTVVIDPLGPRWAGVDCRAALTATD